MAAKKKARKSTKKKAKAKKKAPAKKKGALRRYHGVGGGHVSDTDLDHGVGGGHDPEPGPNRENDE